MTSRSEFFAGLRETAERVEHGLNLRGKTRVSCGSCGGKGHSEPSRIDYDAHGSYWVESRPCLFCGGESSIEVDCSPAAEEAAIKREVERLRKRLKELRRK